MFQNPAPSHPFKLLPTPQVSRIQPNQTGMRMGLSCGHTSPSRPTKEPDTDTCSTLEPSSLSSPAIFMSQVPQPSGSRSVQQSATARAEDLVRLGAWGRGDFGEAPVWPLVLLVQSMRSPTGAGPLLRPSPSPAPRPAASAGTQLLGADGR